MESDTAQNLNKFFTFLTKPTIFIISIIVTVFITSYVNNYLAKAKPYVELVNLDFARVPDTELRISPSPKLINLIRDTGIFIQNFQRLYTVQEWKELIQFAEFQKLIYPSAITTVDNIILKLETTSFDNQTVVNSVRDEIIKAVDSVPLNLIEFSVKQVLRNEGYSRKFHNNPIYSNYLVHPKDWSKPSQGRHVLSNTRTYNLWEIKPKEDEQNAEILEDIFINNIYRRLFIYMDKDLLLELFKKASIFLSVTKPNIEKFVTELNDELNRSNPEKIHCVMAFSNLGQKTATIKGNGSLILIKAEKNIPIEIEAIRDAKSYPAFPLDGESSIIIEFYSVKTVSEIEEQLPSLKAAYKEKTMRCEIKLSRLTESLKYDDLTPTHTTSFGKI